MLLIGSTSAGGGGEISGSSGAIGGAIYCATCCIMGASRCRTVGCTGGFRTTYGFAIVGSQYAAKNNASMERSFGPRRVRFAPLVEIFSAG